MSKTVDETDEQSEWDTLYNALHATCERFGKEDFRGRADFFIVEDDWGGDVSQKVIVTSPSFLTPQVVAAISQCIRDAGLLGAQVIVSLELSVPGGSDLPPMGVRIGSGGALEEWDLELIRKQVGDDFYRDRTPH